MSDAEFSIWQKEENRIRFEYNQAYYQTVFCPESELEKAKEMLQIWSHKWFSH